MADLSQLSDEDLDIYESLLAKKQGDPNKVTMPVPQPEGLKGPPVSGFKQALQNIPGSLANAVSHPTFPGMPISQPVTAPGEELGPTPEKVGRELQSFARPFMHPVEALKEDPVGTTLGAAQILHGGQGKPQQVAMGAAKGAAKGATEMVPFSRYGHKMNLPASLVGAAGGELMGYGFHALSPKAPLIGAAIGGSIPLIRGAYRGGREALNDIRSSERTPDTKWMEGPVAPLGNSDVPVGPIVKPELPSGRKVGKPSEVPVPGAETLPVEPLKPEGGQVPRAEPAPQSAPIETVSEEVPTTEKIKSPFEISAEPHMNDPLFETMLKDQGTHGTRTFINKYIDTVEEIKKVNSELTNKAETITPERLRTDPSVDKQLEIIIRGTKSAGGSKRKGLSTRFPKEAKEFLAKLLDEKQSEPPSK